MLDEKTKLLSIQKGLKVVKKYDKKNELGYVDYLLESDIDAFNEQVSPECLKEMVHSTLSSHSKDNLTLKKEKK